MSNAKRLLEQAIELLVDTVNYDNGDYRDFIAEAEAEIILLGETP